MKVFLLLLFILSIESKKPIRKFVLIRDDQMDKNGYSKFSILDSSEKQYLYRLKTSYDDNNEGLHLVEYPSKDTIAYLQGQWKNETLNVTFEIFDYKINEWIHGTIHKTFDLFTEKYFIKWENESFLMKKKIISMNHKFYDQYQNILAKFRKRFRWFNWSSVKYDLNIFHEKLPDAIYFLSLAIVDHRNIIQ